jgi:septal ring factor EnvC (AmiA/AmiB activator)
MDAPVRHSALLLDLITRPITTTTSIPPLADLISLQSNLEALRSSANKRLRVLDSSRRQVEALRDRDAQRERESSSFDKKKSERTRHDDEREDERKRRERDREREKERDSERERETEKEKDREKERAKRERDKVRRDSEREEIDRERKEAEMQPGRNKLLGGKGKPATSASSSFSASLGGKTAPPGSQPPPFQVKTEAGPSLSPFLLASLDRCTR